MIRRLGISAAIVTIATLACLAAPAAARGLGVELWTDRGTDAVFQPGEVMTVKVRVSDDAHLLVYEIDAEGRVRVLSPWRGGSGFVEGRRTYVLPPEHADVELVVEEPMGQGYLVAIASREPFDRLPWYLRPYDPQAEHVGFVGAEDEEEGITAEGRIVGDPFVAMERIRRRVLARPNDGDEFATTYVSYYVHERVRYPRYICSDCHRPGRWAWWDGFDPYYAHCSVVDFRVNWSWYWGPTYWFGHVPYYVYVPRWDCPPHYRWDGWYSSWDGWRGWCRTWPRIDRRYKAPMPVGYVPPDKFDEGRPRNRGPRPVPPGVIADNGSRTLPIGRNRPARDGDRSTPDRRGSVGRVPVERAPVNEDAPERRSGERDERWYDRPGVRRGDSGVKPLPTRQPAREDRPWYDRGGLERPAPRLERPAPRPEPRRDDPRRDDPRREEPRYERPASRPEPRREEPRYERPAPRSEPRREEPRYERPAPRSEPRREEAHVERPASKSEPRREEARPEPPRRESRPEPAREPRGGGRRGGR